MSRRRPWRWSRRVRPGQEVVTMMLQPEDPRPGRSADHERNDHERPTGAAADATDDGDLHASIGSAEPAWVLPSIVLGFVALTGSGVLFAVLAVIGITFWLLNTPLSEQDRKGFGQRWPGPFGGPGPL
jgi:hypothetical protein